MITSKTNFTPGNIIAGLGVIGSFIVAHADAIGNLVPQWAAYIPMVTTIIGLFSHSILHHDTTNGPTT